MCHCQQTIWTEGLDQKQAMNGLSNRSWKGETGLDGQVRKPSSTPSSFQFSIPFLPSCSENQIFRELIIPLKELLQHSNEMLIFCLHFDSQKKLTIFSWFVFCDILITCLIAHVVSPLKAYLDKMLLDSTEMLLVYKIYSLEVWPWSDFNFQGQRITSPVIQ